ncbi:plasmid pRiA4b ORF-3 family protein [Gordonia rubripertincta]|uniref:plasmid pRiA4b ORF-3 family protein n=1 Tax=Gordonia rubripertincta TaxID=36822 RepID=UPI000B8D27BB|nr:plasmid pRiA4b ORF-3 family protein [Gordonia rubripertincta]ASR01812.1 Plasmid pRiA4b ORF-3-like protein [Gordonia rubripertincta]
MHDPGHESPDAEELRRQFEAMLAGLQPNELPTLLNQLSRTAADRSERPPSIRYRKEPLAETVVFRIRVDLDDARPPIWRRLDVRSDISLEDLHRVVQAAFGWLDYHLYRFALGGSPFDRRSELFLCPFDAQEGEEVGTPVAEVRLDETLHEQGDALRYVYDYGDSWELTLQVESVREASEDTPWARCVDGRRAAPPEDCGGITDAKSLAEVVDDPAHFDVDEVNAALSDPIRSLVDTGIDARLGHLLYLVQPLDESGAVTASATRLAASSTIATGDQLEADLLPYLWFLRRARDEGFTLTSAGYLKPADVVAASKVLPTMKYFIGAKNREVQSTPVLYFRESLLRMGLLRKHKGRLLPTRVGTKLADDPQALADHLADRLLNQKMDGFTEDASLLMLFFAAASEPGDEMPLETIGALLTAYRWQGTDGRPIQKYDLYDLDNGIYEFLEAVSPPERGLRGVTLSPTAIEVARRAIHHR